MKEMEVTVLKCAGVVILFFPVMGMARITLDVMSIFQQLWYCAALFAMMVFAFPKLRGVLAGELAKAPAFTHKVIAFFGQYDGVIWPVYVSTVMIYIIISAPLSPGQKIETLEVMMVFFYVAFAVIGGLYAFRAAQKEQPFWSTLAKREVNKG